MTSGDSVAGQVGRALDFDGGNDVISFPSSGWDVGPFTIEALFYARTIGQGTSGKILSVHSFYKQRQPAAARCCQ